MWRSLTIWRGDLPRRGGNRQHRRRNAGGLAPARSHGRRGWPCRHLGAAAAALGPGAPEKSRAAWHTNKKAVACSNGLFAGIMCEEGISMLMLPHPLADLATTYSPAS